MIDQDVQAVCAEYSVKILPANVAPQVGTTRAPATLALIKRKHGVEHMRMVVSLLVESENNAQVLISDVFLAISDVIRAMKKNYPHILEKETSKFYEFFDETPIGSLYYLFCLPLESITSKRKALVGLIWERVERKFGKLSQQRDWLDDRKGKS